MEVQLWNRRDKGFLLIEWLAAIFMCGILSSMLYAGSVALQRMIAILQVETAAREFAQDILSVRERALAGHNLGFVELSSGWNGYKVYRRPNLVDKQRDFASAGSEVFQFSRIPSTTIKFSANGAPLASGTYVLQHKNIPSIKVSVSILPVTGRLRIERQM